VQPLDLNLSSRPFRNNVPLWVGYSIVVTLLLLSTVWNVRTYTGNAAKIDDLQQRTVSLDGQNQELRQRERKAQMGIGRYDVEALRAQAEKANEIIAWKAFSWTRLFNLVAEMMPHDVKMTSIRPIFQIRAGAASQDGAGFAEGVPVAIDAMAKRHEDMLELQNALFEHENFGRVEMQRFSTLDNSEIVFQLRFLYYPGVGFEDGEELTVAEGELAESEPETDSVEPAADEAEAQGEIAGGQPS